MAGRAPQKLSPHVTGKPHPGSNIETTGGSEKDWRLTIKYHRYAVLFKISQLWIVFMCQKRMRVDISMVRRKRKPNAVDFHG
jgi:hypothetical protein